MIRNGLDWQRHVCLLLRQKYGDQFVPVPDGKHGDWGIEGYSTDGHIYQCYRPNEPLSTEDRYKKYRAKCNDDLNKLRDNQGELKKLFGATPMTSWILVVPVHNDKEILKYLSGKEIEVQAWALNFANPKFKLLVWTDTDDFAVEMEAIEKIRKAKVTLPGPGVESGHVNDWATQNDGIVKTIDEKLARGYPAKKLEDRIDLRNALIRWYIEGQNLLLRLQKGFPEYYQAAVNVKDQAEGLLEQKLLMAKINGDYMSQLISELKTDFMHDCDNLSATHANELSNECIGDWIMRCPLDFEDQT